MAYNLIIIDVAMTNKTHDTPVYSIGTVARMLGVSVQTLRMYDSEGLIITFKTAGNQRLYSDADVERIECIRKAINVDKISIAGIKLIHSMIPCWNIVQCSDEERETLFNSRSHTGGCWTYKKEHSLCTNRECRLCEVYQLSGHCDRVREEIHKLGSHLLEQQISPQV
jgi:MerR family transcriptional regulator, heat shock protein HspR